MCMGGGALLYFALHIIKPIALVLLAIPYIPLSLFSGRRTGDNSKNYETMDLPKRTEPTKGTGFVLIFPTFNLVIYIYSQIKHAHFLFEFFTHLR